MGRRVGGGLSCVGARTNAQEAPGQTAPETPPSTQQTPPSTQQSPAPAVTYPLADSTPVEPISIELFYWLTRATPVLRGGKANLNTVPGNLDFRARASLAREA